MPNKSMLRKSTVVLALIISSSAFLWGDQKKASAPPPIQPTQQPARASDAVVLAMLDAVTVAEPTSGTPLLEQVAQQPSSVSIIVPGNQPWTATGVNLKQGELFSVTASGGVAFSAGSPPEGPGGDPQDCMTLANGPSGWRAQAFVANNLPCYSLLGRIGEEGAIFEIGTGSTLKSRSSGRLYLGVNDNYFPDNSGSWKANISVGPGGATTPTATRQTRGEGAAEVTASQLKRGHKLPIKIWNEQDLDTPVPFVKQLIINSSKYAQFEADNLRNIQFFDQAGRIIPSWLESGASASSTRSVYWLRLAGGIPAHGAVTIFMAFAPTTQNQFNGTTTGEAPGLSPEYAQYDNGARVFTQYANFAGTSLPAGWSRSVTPGSRGAVVIHNGVHIWHSGTGGGASFLGSDWFVQGNVAEMHVLSEMTDNGQDMVMFCTSSPREDAWVPGSVGFQNGSGLEVENNQSGTPSVLATASLNPMLPAVIGFQGNTVFANYEPVITTAGPICGGGYLGAWANTGFNASFSFDWIRMRPAEPGRAMPKAAAPQNTSSAGQNSQGQATWAEELSAWRAERASDLDAPDGLLSQAALDLLQSGNNSVGSAATNQVLLPQGPPEVGIFHVQFERWRVNVDNPPDYMTVASVGLEPPSGGFPEGLLVDGKPPRPGQGLRVCGMPTWDPPSTLTFGSLRIRLEMHVGNRVALNMKDANAPARINFHGLRWYPPNPAYRVRGKWIPYKPQTKSMSRSTGAVKQPSPGVAEFTLGGKQFRIEATVCPFIPFTHMHLHPGMVRHLQQTLGQLRFAISDPTNRDKTYPGGRWLYTSFPANGLDQPGDLWLDFNRLENPLWAYTNVSEWGPPPQKLPLPIPAGEQRYHD